jgi:hypothetical protein
VSHKLAHSDIIFSSNPRCAMEIQCLEEVQDQTTAIGEDTDGSIKHFNTKTDSRIAHSDWEDASSMDLVTSFKTEEGPEVFKRVRFLSRWEFRNESRGKLRYRINQYNWWTTTCPEAFVMRKTLRIAFEKKADSLSFARQKHKTWDRALCINLFFVGKTLQQSVPVLFIFSMDQKMRRKAWDLFAELDWIRAHPSLILLTTCHSIFHPAVKRFYQSRHEFMTYHRSLCCKASPT